MKSLQQEKEVSKWYKIHTARYALFGAIFGFLFPIMAVSIDLYRFDLDFTIKNLSYYSTSSSSTTTLLVVVLLLLY